MKLKTLKDLFICEPCRERAKAEVIKWVKEDIEDCNSDDWMVNRWKNRLNITESDLK